ncbi:MAG: hypothetical protein ACR2G4_02765 [Pyrinomonadaceae bacterium]
MINRRTIFLAAISALLFTFCLPGLAAAQSNDPWRRDRDRDYRRDRNRDDRRDHRHDDDDDHDNDRYGRSGRYGNNDSRYLRDVAERVKDRSRSFERSVDRFLDNSRVNNTRREDHINDDVKEFRQAADRFRNRIGDGRDLNRSSQEARNLIQAADHAERMLSRLRVDSRTYADWREIKQDLRVVANAYGFRYDGYDDGYYRRGGNNDRRDRDGRNGRNDDLWRRLPSIINGRP